LGIKSVSSGLQFKLSPSAFRVSSRLSRCRALGIALTSGNDQEEETDLFRLQTQFKVKSLSFIRTLCTLPAVIRNWQVVIRGLYQIPC